MNLFTESVIPGDHGKAFETDAKDEAQLTKLKDNLLKLDGVKDIIIDEDKFPKEITVHTDAIVKVKKIQDTVTACGFHAVPKTTFPLWDTSIEKGGYKN